MLNLIAKNFQRSCHVELDLDILFIKLTAQIGCLFLFVMPVFICNILQGASIMELFQICLVVSQNLGEDTLVQMFCWYVREKLGS